MTPEEIRQRLRAMRDPAYREFHAKLIPNIDPDTILGVRTPDVRKFAKELAKEEDVTDFLKQLPHLYYDENILHGCILSILLGKKITLIDNSYGKNGNFYNTWLSDLDNVTLNPK